MAIHIYGKGRNIHVWIVYIHQSQGGGCDGGRKEGKMELQRGAYGLSKYTYNVFISEKEDLEKIWQIIKFYKAEYWDTGIY